VVLEANTFDTEDAIEVATQLTALQCGKKL
jgi:hypothetical protein